MPNNRTPRKSGAEVVDPLAESMVEIPPADEPAGSDEELTPEQARIQELEHQLALERGKKDVEPEPQVSFDGLGEDGNLLVHVLEDGLTHAGKVWFRGQEMEFVPGSRQWRETCDRSGWSWLSLVDNEFGQAERWGKVMFRRGPWPGRSYLDAAAVPFDGDPPSESELRRAEQAESARRRAVPLLPVR